MGNVKKIGNEYVIEFYARGLKYQQKAGSDKTKAETLLKDIEAKIARGEAALIVRDVDADIFFHDFLEYAKSNFPQKTFERFQKTVLHFQSFLKSKFPAAAKLSEVTPAVMEHYKAYLVKGRPFACLPSASPRGEPDRQGSPLARGMTTGKCCIKPHRHDGVASDAVKIFPLDKVRPKVVNLTFFLLRDAFEYAIKLAYLNDNPVLHIRLLPVSFFTPKILDDVKAVKLLDDWSQTQAVGKEELERLAKKIFPYEHIPAPMFRHTVAVALAKKKVSLFRIQKILGIDDIAKLMIYMSFIPRELEI